MARGRDARRHGARARRPSPRATRRARAPPAGELTEAQLEALLFVAERPLSRREIAALAGVDRATVDERLGDLEVSLAGRGIRLILAGDRVELATSPGGRCPRGPVCRRGCGAALARGARDARDRRLSPARHPRGDRADPRRRLGLHRAGAAAPPADRRAGPLRCARAGRSCTGPASSSSSGSDSRRSTTCRRSTSRSQHGSWTATPRRPSRSASAPTPAAGDADA